MKNYSIADSVFNVNLKYTQLQNQTKELFFRCLDENRDINYFRAKIRDIWGNLDHSFMEDEIASYEGFIHEQNMELFGKEIYVNEIGIDYLNVSENFGKIQTQENRFVIQKEREYQNSLKSLAYNVDKDEYLKLKVKKYTNQIVPYYSTTTGDISRYVELSTYCSMLHNTSLTRTGWNTTLNDAEMLGYTKFIIPYHSFSCPYCASHQNKVMTAKQVMNLIGHLEEQEGDLLHPNCKCVLTIYDKNIPYKKSPYSKGEMEEQYQIRQKVNSLTLQKEKVNTDIKIQDRLGNQSEVDRLNQQKSKINKEIRQLKEALPTTELKKQVVAINR